ncbi:hypothetical protein PROFUN_03245 [Planoprotostelium fungivorum]|uniref:Bulb-type lectin domain-containing protein n=1 Tax=Planoprotostelium fungivorum TaxID=1890364 RepID=A0A2P6NWK0_9EUKA|nr:hypothetical protein PROFUN_03245 [Planoprotostelium fungivorum]
MIWYYRYGLCFSGFVVVVRRNRWLLLSSAELNKVIMESTAITGNLIARPTAGTTQEGTQPPQQLKNQRRRYSVLQYRHSFCHPCLGHNCAKISLFHASSPMKRLLLVFLILVAHSDACVAPASVGFSDTILQNALKQGGVNYILSLCQDAVYSLNATIEFTAAGQEISTDGYPSGDARAALVVAGSSISIAISGHLDGLKIKNIQVTAKQGLGRLQDGGANIEIGGNSRGQVVDDIRSYDPRGWSCLHMTEGGCTGGIITNSQFGPAGYSNGEWADGISLACENALVANNVITDATDGNIVVFGAPGSRITNNTIIVDSRIALGGINLVDYAPYSGDYRATVVDRNTIWAKGAQIKVAIAVGTRVWGDRSGNNNYGGAVINNLIKGDFLAYGVAVSGVNNFTVTNNTFQGSFSGSKCVSLIFSSHLYSAGCNLHSTLNAQPTAMLYDPSWVFNSALQSGYIKGQADGCICIQPGISPSITFLAGQFSLSSGQSLQMDGSNFTLQDNCNLVARDTNGKAMWASGTQGYSGECTVNFRDDGRLVISDLGQDIWVFPNYTGDLTGGRITFSSQESYVTIIDSTGNIVYATEYTFPGFELYTPSFVHQLGTDGTSYYLTINSNGTITVSTGAPGFGGNVLWASQNFRPGNCSQTSQCFLTLQPGDGNLVLYNSTYTAFWASGTGSSFATAVRFNSFQPYLETLNATGWTQVASSDSCSANKPCKNGLICNGAYCGSQAWASGDAYKLGPVADFTNALTRSTFTTSGASSDSTASTSSTVSVPVSTTSTTNPVLTASTTTPVLAGDAATLVSSFFLLGLFLFC